MLAVVNLKEVSLKTFVVFKAKLCDPSKSAITIPNKLRS